MRTQFNGIVMNIIVLHFTLSIHLCWHRMWRVLSRFSFKKKWRYSLPFVDFNIPVCNCKLIYHFRDFCMEEMNQRRLVWKREGHWFDTAKVAFDRGEFNERVPVERLKWQRFFKRSGVHVQLTIRCFRCGSII